MSVHNICDHRSDDKNTQVDVVFEIDCSDPAHGVPKSAPKRWNAWMSSTSVYSAFMSAGGMKGLVTMYFYDQGVVKEHHPMMTWIHPDLDDQPFNAQEALKKELIRPY